MNILHPIPDCPLTCAFRNKDQCVCNLIALHNDKSPISYGLHVGLGSFYGSQALPPCVRGPLGSAHWSIAAEAGAEPPPGEPAVFAEAEK